MTHSLSLLEREREKERERERDLDSGRQPALGSADEGRYVDDPVVQEMVHICLGR